MMIAQHQTEAASRPIITSFTTKEAPQNMAKTEPSAPEASGVAAISFMKAILANPCGARNFLRARTSAVQIGQFCGPARRMRPGALRRQLSRRHG